MKITVVRNRLRAARVLITLPSCYSRRVRHTTAKLTTSALLIVLTGYGAWEDRRQSKDLGFYLHLTKPVDLSELEQAIQSMR